jgi:hypothetical protein
MRLGIKYDIGDGPQEAVAGVRAQVGWELRTKKTIGDFASAFSVAGLVGLLFEQLKIDGTLPEGVATEQQLAARLVDIDPADITSTVVPTEPGPPPGS